MAARDAQFIALLDAFRPTGGILRGEELAELLARRGCGGHASLARSMVAGEILCFEWDQAFWVPAFQLEGYGLSVGAGTRRVLAELENRCDGWAAALWLATPNGWLDDRRPVDAMRNDLAAVLNAARADAFIANG